MENPTSSTNARTIAPTTPNAPSAAPAPVAAPAGTTTEIGASDLPALEPRAFQAEYRRYIDQALALRAEEVDPFHGDVLAILRNVRIGVASLMPHMDEVRKELPAVRSDAVTEIVGLTEALYHSTRLITAPVSPHEVSERFQRVSPLRKEMLRAAETFARRGFFPADRVAKIRAGSGRIDAATDAMDLAALYVDFQAAVAGKHPFTREEIDGLADDGAWLVRVLTKDGLRKEEVNRSGVNPREIRDRLYTLVARGHKTLRRVGTYLWEDQVDRYVPKLGSRTGSRQNTGASTEAEPAGTMTEGTSTSAGSTSSTATQ